MTRSAALQTKWRRERKRHGEAFRRRDRGPITAMPEPLLCTGIPLFVSMLISTVHHTVVDRPLKGALLASYATWPPSSMMAGHAETVDAVSVTIGVDAAFLARDP